MDESRLQCEEIIKEYLGYRGFQNTLECFAIERRRCTQSSPQHEYGRSQKTKEMNDKAIIRSFLHAFDEGNALELFRLWQLIEDTGLTFPQKQRSEGVALEFLTQVHAAVWPFRECVLLRQPSSDQASRVCGKAMALFKRYLEGKGKHLCLDPFFIPYFALPYVADPIAHPSFKAVFHKKWVLELREDLEDFLVRTLLSKEREGAQFRGPRLIQLVIRQAEWEKDDGVKQMQLAEKTESAPVEKPGPVVQHRNGSNRAILAPLDYEKIKATLRRLSRLAWETNSSRKRSLGGGGGALSMTTTGASTAAAHAAAMDCALVIQALRLRFTRAEAGKNRRALLYHFVRNDVLGLHRHAAAGAGSTSNGSAEGSTDSLLKEMLVGNARDGEIDGDTDESMRSNGGLNSDHPGTMVAEEAARLLNALTIMGKARKYIMGSGPPVKQGPGGALRLLVGVLKKESRDTPVRRHILGTLQKCSLKRSVQKSMVDLGVLSWIAKVLHAHSQHEGSGDGDGGDVSLYSLEYATAMLMNLVSRKAGRTAAEAVEPDLVLVLSNLLEVESPLVREYVNGCLYSLLVSPELKNRAMAMGMDVMLRGLIEHSHEEQAKRQLGFILEQLQDPPPNDQSSNEDADSTAGEDDEDDADEGLDSNPDDVPEREDIVRYIESREAPSGEELLCSTYLQRDTQLASAALQLSIETEEVENEWLLMGGAMRGPNSGGPSKGASKGAKKRMAGTGGALTPVVIPERNPTPEAGKVVLLGGVPKKYDQTLGAVPADLQTRPRIPRTPPEGSPLPLDKTGPATRHSQNERHYGRSLNEGGRGHEHRLAQEVMDDTHEHEHVGEESVAGREGQANGYDNHQGEGPTHGKHGRDATLEKTSADSDAQSVKVPEQKVEKVEGRPSLAKTFGAPISSRVPNGEHGRSDGAKEVPQSGRSDASGASGGSSGSYESNFSVDMESTAA